MNTEFLKRNYDNIIRPLIVLLFTTIMVILGYIIYELTNSIIISYIITLILFLSKYSS